MLVPPSNCESQAYIYNNDEAPCGMKGPKNKSNTPRNESFVNSNLSFVKYLQ